MAITVEKVCHSPYQGRRGNTWAKRNARRKMRRAAKRDPEDAPTKNRYHGWVL